MAWLIFTFSFNQGLQKGWLKERWELVLVKECKIIISTNYNSLRTSSDLYSW